MHTSVMENRQVGAKRVRFEESLLHVDLTDGRVITLPIEQVPWLRWLADASPEERENWSIEPGGYAVYWETLDDGFEIAHALNLEPVK